MRLGAVMLLVMLGFAGYLVLAMPNQDARGVALQEVPGGDAERGRMIIRSYGCGSCHVVPGVPGANGSVGPPLTEFARRAYIAGALPNNPDNLVRWIVNPQAVEPGTAMPTIGLSEEEARHIAAYLATLR
ncbi:MAG TPA: c-type cytochrome [Roseiflexaceae bacterium]|nr:c-type cytochrome [Roseiflexaceae bacterium]